MHSSTKKQTKSKARKSTKTRSQKTSSLASQTTTLTSNTRPISQRKAKVCGSNNNHNTTQTLSPTHTSFTSHTSPTSQSRRYRFNHNGQFIDDGYDDSSELGDSEPERLSPPSNGKLKRQLNAAQKSLKRLASFSDGRSLVGVINSPEFIRLKESIEVVEDQSYRTQTSETTVTILQLQKWLIKQTEENPDVPFYRIIHNSIPKVFPNMGGVARTHDDVEDDDNDHDKPLSFFQKLQKQKKLQNKRNTDGIWIMRRFFWKQKSGLVSLGNIPIEWAQLAACVLNDRPYPKLQNLASIATYTKFCGFPCELYNPVEQQVLSQYSGEDKLEIAGDIVAQLVNTNPVLIAHMNALSHPSSRRSLLGANWFQSIVQMVTLVMAFEARLNQYQLENAQVGNAHIPFATVLKKHFSSSGTPLHRANPEKSREDDLELLYNFDVITGAEGVIKNEPYFSQKKFHAYLGGHNLSALSNSLQLDDLYMLVALCGEVLNKITQGVETKRGIKYSSEPLLAASFQLDDMADLLKRVMDEADLENTHQILLDHDKKVLEEKRKMRGQDGNDDADDEHFGDTSEDERELKAMEEKNKAKKDLAEKNQFEMELDQHIARLEQEEIEKERKLSLDNAIQTSTIHEVQIKNHQDTKKNLTQEKEQVDDFEDDGLDNTPMYIPRLSPHFVYPLDESRSFIRGFSSVDLVEFLEDSIIVEGIEKGYKRSHHLKQVLNFDIMRSKNWCELDCVVIPKHVIDADHDENEDPTYNKIVDESSPNKALLEDLEQIYPNMLVQDSSTLQSNANLDLQVLAQKLKDDELNFQEVEKQRQAALNIAIEDIEVAPWRRPSTKK